MLYNVSEISVSLNQLQSPIIHSFSLSSHSPYVIIYSCFLFLFTYSIYINLFEMGKVGKYMSHCVQDVYGAMGCVVRPGGRGGGGKGGR